VSVAQRNRPSVSVTLPADLIEKLEADAKAGDVSLSQVIEAYCREHYQGNVMQHLEHLESSLNELKARVMPVVEKVAGLLEQADQEGVLTGQGSAEPAPKIATYEEIYGPIPHTPQPPWRPPVAAPKPERRWPWRG
jgi:hypothetical protein